MSRLASLTFFCLALFLVATTLVVKKPGLPMQLFGEEPTYFMITHSVVLDRVLRCEVQDLRRLYDEFPFIHRPFLALASPDGWNTAFFDRPLLYPMLSAPWVALFGANGMVAWNMILFLGMIWLAASHLRRAGPRAAGGLALLLAVGFFLLSTTWVYVFHLLPEILGAAAVTACLTWGWRAAGGWRTAGEQRAAGEQGGKFAPTAGSPQRRSAGSAAWALASGLTLAPLVEHSPWLLLLTLPLLLVFWQQRQWRGLCAFLLGSGLALLLLWGLARLQPWTAQATSTARQVVTLKDPLAMPQLGDRTVPAPADPDAAGEARWGGETLAWSGRPITTRLTHFLWGRHAGLLPYFPLVLLALGSFFLRGRRALAQWTLLAAVLGTLAALPGVGTLTDRPPMVGNPDLVWVYPAFFFLSGALAPGWIVAGYAVATWCLGALLWTPLGAPLPAASSQAHTRNWPFAALPLEVHLLPWLPDYRVVESLGERLWARADQTKAVVDEFWLLGGEEVELWLERQAPLAKGVVSLRNLVSHQNIELHFAEQHETLSFDEVPLEGAGQRREMTPSEPTYQLTAGKAPVFLYRIRVESERGNNLAWHQPGRPYHYTGAIVAYLGPPEVLNHDIYPLTWLSCGAPSTVSVEESFLGLVELQHHGAAPWPSRGPARVRLAYHWLDANGNPRIFDGVRTDLVQDLAPGQTLKSWQEVQAPKQPGRYWLEFDPVFEHVAWFSQRNQRTTCRTAVEVKTAEGIKAAARSGPGPAAARPAPAPPKTSPGSASGSGSRPAPRQKAASQAASPRATG